MSCRVEVTAKNDEEATQKAWDKFSQYQEEYIDSYLWDTGLNDPELEEINIIDPKPTPKKKVKAT